MPYEYLQKGGKIASWSPFWPRGDAHSDKLGLSRKTHIVPGVACLNPPAG